MAARPPRTAASLAAVALAVAVVAAGAVRADEDEDDDDHERARAAFEAGEIAPLKDILAQAERDFAGGSLLEVELEREGRHWVYELTLLAPGGRVLELEYDARSRELLHARGHYLGRGRPGETFDEEDED